MASFYSLWYEHNVRGKKRTQNSSFDTVKTNLTAAQVTVHSVQDKLVYNLEFKPVISPKKTPHDRTRQSSIISSSNRSRQHSRNVSTISGFSTTSTASSTLCEESLWDDWIVKFINEDHESQSNAVEESMMEEWIFDTSAQ